MVNDYVTVTNKPPRDHLEEGHESQTENQIHENEFANGGTPSAKKQLKKILLSPVQYQFLLLTIKYTHTISKVGFIP